MAANNESISDQLEILQKYLREIENRVLTIELELGMKYRSTAKPEESDSALTDGIPEGGPTGHKFESGFGEKGLAVVGNVVLVLGISFLLEFIRSKGYGLASSLTGYLITAGIFGLSIRLSRSFKFLSRALIYTSLILLFIITLNLHFFTETPVIANNIISLIILSVISLLPLVFSVIHDSERLAGLSILMIVCTGIFSDLDQFNLTLLFMASMVSVVLYFRIGWWQNLIFTIIVVYLGFTFWILNNPFVGNTLEFIKEPQNGLFYLVGVGAIFSLMALRWGKSTTKENIALSGLIINGVFFSSLLVLFVFLFYKDNYILLFSIITLYCLSYATLLKSVSAWKFTSAFFALYGFLALSITVFGIYGFPRVYWLLALQSLLVVSMALWFRNKIIVVMNSVLFILLYLLYLSSMEPLNEVNYSFALVSLVTARIINWKKDRLEIKTEYLRNLYLFSGFFMVPFALYHSVPDNFITLSWTLLSVSYFGLSFLLKNVKYRYLALGTLIAVAIHLLLVDLSRIDIIYRVMAFLFLALISILISVYYTRGKKKSQDERIEQG